MVMRILNEKEINEFNKNYNTDFKSIMIKQSGNKYYAIFDGIKKIKIYKNEAMKYL